jgi:tetratricopeptide (TPR) repeat protein
MIKPLKSAQKSVWLLCWLDLDDPVPAGSDYMLPTLVMVTDRRGVPVAPPEVMEELDQTGAENVLGSLIERLGPPDRILIGESEDWDDRSWRDFSEDFRVPIEFVKVLDRKTDEMEVISQHVVAKFTADYIQSGTSSPPGLAQGLTNTALRVRSETKKVALLKKALESDQSCSEARVELADAYFRRSDWIGAFKAYDDVIARERRRLDNQNPDWWTSRSTRPYLRALYGRAMTQWHQGRHAAAGETLSGLLRINAKDHQGVRFLIPLIWLLAEDYDSAEKSYSHCAKSYPLDYSEPSFAFGKGLMHSYFGREQEAVTAYQEGIFKNIYIAPMILDQPMPPDTIWQPNDRADANFAREFVESYSILWDRVPSARRNLRDAWESSAPRIAGLVEHRAHMFESQDQRYEPDYKTIWQALVAEDERLSA